LLVKEGVDSLSQCGGEGADPLHPTQEGPGRGFGIPRGGWWGWGGGRRLPPGLSPWTVEGFDRSIDT